MQTVVYDGFNFQEIGVNEFLEGIKDYGCHGGKVMACKPNKNSILLVAVDPEGELQDFLRLEGFDRVTTYAQHGYLTSDGLAFLKAEAGDNVRYFSIGQEPIEMYVGSYNRGRILAAVEEAAEEEGFDFDVNTWESCLDQLEAAPNFKRPDVVGVFVTM